MYNMFSCCICKKEYLLYSSRCDKCDKLYKLGVVYGWDTIYTIIDRCLVIPSENQEKKIERAVKLLGNSKE